MKWEAERVKTVPNLKTTLEALSEGDGKQNFVSYAEKIHANYRLITGEYLYNKERALWNMRLYRLKKRSMDKAIQTIFTMAKGKNVVIGVGDAHFAATGKGEKAVPTTALTKALFKAKHRYNGKVKFVNVWEYNTTKKCCECGHDTEKGIQANGRHSNRLRLCPNCGNKTTIKQRDRDVQAARNILWLLQHKLAGSVRPWHLCQRELGLRPPNPDKPCS